MYMYNFTFYKIIIEQQVFTCLWDKGIGISKSIHVTTSLHGGVVNDPL